MSLCLGIPTIKKKKEHPRNEDHLKCTDWCLITCLGCGQRICFKNKNNLYNVDGEVFGDVECFEHYNKEHLKWLESFMDKPEQE